MRFSSFIILFLLVLAACREPPKWTALEVIAMVGQQPGGASEIVMSEENTAIAKCVGYGQRCVMGSGKIFKYGLLNFVAVEFMTQEDAWFAARELGQFYSRNWLFDDVSREPSVEKLLKDRFNARKPLPDESEPPEYERD